MIIKPKIRGFICTTAHPEGCAESVRRQIAVVQAKKPVAGAKKVLVIGASTGYGLASRIAAAFGMGADTIGLFFERPATDDRTATAGWYNTAAFEKAAREAGLVAESLNGDAFSQEVKEEAVRLIREKLGKVDLVVYSVAAPRRTDPVTGEVYSSVLKPIGQAFANKSVNVQNGAVSEVTLEPASDEEIRQTAKVMGGEDWTLWMQLLAKEGLLADNVITLAYSYIGPEVTHAIYREGTIGRAKDHLEATARQLTEELAPYHGRAYVSVNKALVTQASSAIPVVPLYISLLYKLMKAKGTHEGCIEQMARMMERIYGAEGEVPTDAEGRIRMDDWEMDEGIQSEINQAWSAVSTETLPQLGDLEGYRQDFLQLFGFGFDNVDYEADVNPNVQL
ncbi:enoyl-ACP reductase FabV [Paenibacillus sp. YN15]|uniref:enoyl-ACP reductase FabV n=1 Tax=Paenibacillus sp. YN15 TaxID=1742774 RepID=UPI000DCD9B20|nr:enoyl-ACP reductase FabV [Paenibacillus sp. YN15]RAU97899.1 bifunctional NADH-specific enoyl-ACP reductase/trans-2-enoyl-CoA reductase [Paenibacillus sp. YN15]